MDAPVEALTFATLGLRAPLVAAVAALGYEEPTPVQRETIPLLLTGRDMLGQAATGTGKTAAFALPMLHRLGDALPAARETCGLILVPTRELAMQVSEALHKYAKGSGLSVLPLYGGAPMHLQVRALERGAHIVVATPGRALDHMRRGTLSLAAIRMLVLDEADEMLDMGFADDLDEILKATPEDRQTALFSATMPKRIQAIAERHLTSPARITVAREKPVAGDAPRVRQIGYMVHRAHKPAALARILEMEDPVATLVFCRTRLEVESLVETMTAHGLRAEALHGGMVQRQRDKVMATFRAKKADLLVATDVAARGLDIDHLSHVVNYDVPASPEVYMHRIGRTGRAGRTGTAITLAEAREHRLVRTIEQFTKTRLEVATVPTVADLRAKQVELTRASLRERLVAGDSDHVRVIVESLAQEFDLMEIAVAAVAMAHASAASEGSERDIPTIAPRQERPATPTTSRPSPRAVTRDRDAPVREPRPRRTEADDAPSRAPRVDGSRLRRASAPDERPRRDTRAPWTAREPREYGGDTRPPRVARRPETRDGRLVRLFIGAGREAGIRPGDLVGAIAGESGINSRALGSIEIADRFSLVEVPEADADHIVSAMRAATLRGKRVQVRRERER